MDLFVVDPVTWLPTGAPVYFYDSLIWTERFLEPSEMELETKAVKEIRDVLPLETLVSIRQSKEVMMIEEHIIDTDEQGVETLTVRGKSLTTYLRHRVVGEKRGNKYEMALEYSNLDAGLVVLYNAFVNDAAFDLTTATAAYYKKVEDRIPNCVITDSSGTDPGTPLHRWINPGSVENVILNWFGERPIGLRMVRPPYSSQVVSVDQTGAITRTPVTDGLELCFDVYDGEDRSHLQTTNTPVILDVEHNDLMLPNYLLSVLNFKSEAHIALNDKTIFAHNNQVLEDEETPMDQLSGLKRRVIFVDAGEPEEGADAAKFEADSIKSAEEALEDHKKFAAVDGGVSPQTEIQFGVDYFLGDFVSVRGRYGSMTKTRVTEYIRTEDATGEESYPTLVYD